jgi:D-alanyl-D-alanine carboxypeptidase
VRAKTGLLTQVVALSGHALGPEGDERVFSVLVNGFRGDTRGAMNALDRFAEALATAGR